MGIGRMRKVQRYSNEFKITAIRLAGLPGTLIQDVADPRHPSLYALTMEERVPGREDQRQAPSRYGELARWRRRCLNRNASGTGASLEEGPARERPFKKNYSIRCGKKTDAFAFIERHHKDYGLAFLCKHYGVSRSWYYAWKERPMSNRMKANRALLQQIIAIHEESHETYGGPQVYAALKKEGVPCSEKRVARLMHKAGIKGRREGCPSRPRSTTLLRAA